jgi:tRNA 2-thiouridine synthesizing protein A
VTAHPGDGTGTVVVDARGQRCPLPVIRLAAAARDLPAGTLVTVLSTDPAARHDVPAWARMRGHAMAGDPELREPDEGDAVWVLTVRLAAGP